MNVQLYFMKMHIREHTHNFHERHEYSFKSSVKIHEYELYCLNIR